MFTREYSPGIGQAVADRTINRIKNDGTRETWGDVAHRVAVGNTMLHSDDFPSMFHHLSQASLLMSGRHLQHGDADQMSRPQEVFTNCSTAATSFLMFRLLLSGSGVGTDYSDHMQVIDWARDMPNVICIIDPDHQDVRTGEIKAPSFKQALNSIVGQIYKLFRVPDSREGWAEAIMEIEMAAFKKADYVLMLDFSDVRPRGEAIRGMQNRPASGPGPLMEAIVKLSAVRGTEMAPWEAAMHIDHALAECVLVGGARRAARMATKYWKDEDILRFISIKKTGGLWSSNNSILVDETFWAQADIEGTVAHEIYNAAIEAAYLDGTGEPGFINVDKLEFDPTGIEEYLNGKFISDEEIYAKTSDLLRAKAVACINGDYHVITNPCGEIVLFLLGGYCVIADVVPYHALGLADAEDAFRTATRALIRTNQMKSLYAKETKRTNRIGVGFTGIFEYALAQFGYGWHDLIDEQKSQPFWSAMKRFSDAVKQEAFTYANQLGVTVPHTGTTVKPAGTTSKLFNLTEGAHLPARLWYMRWVQFRNDDPLVADYQAKGYPTRALVDYPGTTIVGFPTKPLIVELAEQLGMVDSLVTADQATPEEQYQWLRLLEKYWIGDDQGNQVSYTLKYSPKLVSLEEFKATVLQNQRDVKCCSVMPTTDPEDNPFEYLPEEPISQAEYEAWMAKITQDDEDIDLDSLKCASGACPI